MEYNYRMRNKKQGLGGMNRREITLKNISENIINYNTQTAPNMFESFSEYWTQ
jgi:hypothetical protein